MSPKSGLDILCIDDTASLLNMMRVILNRAGHRVFTAQDGDSGIQRLNRLRTVDVVVTNYLMPRLSGLEVVRYIAAEPRFDHVGVVFHSAVTNIEPARQHAQWPRVDVFLPVPFEPDDLLRAVEAAHASRDGLVRV